MNYIVKALPAALAAAALPFVAAPVFAQGIGTDRVLEPVSVTAVRSPLDPDLPASTYSVTRETLAAQPFLNTEDALAFAPGTSVRKRFSGDRNSNLGGRSFGTTQPARGLAYVDGYLISNFLGRFDAPRWSIVAPQEVERVDVLYGPFSAIYTGNAIGTTVAITTRRPQGFEGSAKIDAQRQTHEDYGLRDSYDNDQQSVFLANRWDRLALSIGANRMAYASHPMGYAQAMPSAAAGTAVVGGVADRDPSGQPRMIVGATGMQRGVQHQAKLKASYDLTPQLQADGFYAHWQNAYRVYNRSLVRDAATGAEIWSGTVNLGSAGYTIPPMVPQRGDEAHEQVGGRLRTRNKAGWNYSVQASHYRVLNNSQRQANSADPVAAAGGPGSHTVGDGTAWSTFELQSTYTPEPGGSHALTFGYHQSRYALKNHVLRLADWRDVTTAANESSNYFGKTQVQALYVQDAWRLAPAWTLTSGLRLERFRAFDGSQFDAAALAQPQINYADRRDTGVSPKLSLAHSVNHAWTVRGSLARGVRFPTVSELFQGTRSQVIIVANDPTLRPEVSDAKELAFLHEGEAGELRISLFEDDIRNVIFLQRQVVGATSVNTVQNVRRVRTRGIEVAYQGSDLFIDGFDLQAGITLADARILDNPVTPVSEGKRWPRVPKLRASALASYRSGLWTTSLGVRHEGRQYGTLDNSDINGNTPGGVSSFAVWNARLAYTVTKLGRFAVGIDNIADRRYYVGPHPYPARTVYAEAQFSF